VRALWPRIKPGLEAVHAKTVPDWIPEDIYTCLRAGTAILLLADEADWFIVVQHQGRIYGSCLLIWILHAPGDYAEFADKVYSELERLARELKATRLEMHSPRRGWERDPHWIRRETIYTREVL